MGTESSRTFSEPTGGVISFSEFPSHRDKAAEVTLPNFLAVSPLFKNFGKYFRLKQQQQQQQRNKHLPHTWTQNIWGTAVKAVRLKAFLYGCF